VEETRFPATALWTSSGYLPEPISSRLEGYGRCVTVRSAYNGPVEGRNAERKFANQGEIRGLEQRDLIDQPFTIGIDEGELELAAVGRWGLLRRVADRLIEKDQSDRP
jgi:hypothetical protein